MSAGNGSKPRWRYADHQDAIANGLVQVLYEHAIGERHMEDSAVRAGIGLLKKFVPDRVEQSVSIQGGIDAPPRSETYDEWRKRREAELAAMGAAAGTANGGH